MSHAIQNLFRTPCFNCGALINKHSVTGDRCPRTEKLGADHATKAGYSATLQFAANAQAAASDYALMPCISVRQPWASLIIFSGKDIENRDWYTGLRGRVLIHAAKGMTHDEYDDAAEFAQQQGVTPPAMRGIPRGGIIGSVEIVDVVEQSSSKWFMGKYGFVLRNPQPLPFTPYKGALGFFNVPMMALNK